MEKSQSTIISPLPNFEKEKSAICCFVGEEYRYTGRDRYAGRRWCVSQTKFIEHTMKNKMDEIKK